GLGHSSLLRCGGRAYSVCGQGAAQAAFACAARPPLTTPAAAAANAPAAASTGCAPAGRSLARPPANARGAARGLPVGRLLSPGFRTEAIMTAFVFRSSLDASFHASLERLVYYNPRQHQAQRAIIDVIDAYGTPMIVSDDAGVRVAVDRRQDAQCLFALTSTAAGLTLAGMIAFLRTSVDETHVLHVALA